MGKVVCEVGDGMKWVIDHLPDTDYNQFKAEFEEVISNLAYKYGYDKDIKKSFRENKVTIISRD